jgi:hypothetical protein
MNFEKKLLLFWVTRFLDFAEDTVWANPHFITLIARPQNLTRDECCIDILTPISVSPEFQAEYNVYFNLLI